ncbi:MAG: sugar transferase [Proteobacteria bacterium]|nr:sugar transferase [Pseudomonadota bacterium]
MFALVAGIGHYVRNAAYYPFVVVDAADQLTLTFLQQPTSDGEACAVLATTIASLMQANCPACKVANQQCLTELPPNLSDLFSEKPLSVSSAHILNGVITYAHPSPPVALATCMESQRQAAASRQRIQVICNPAGAPRPFPPNHFLAIEWTKTLIRDLVQTAFVFGVALLIFLAVQLSSVRSPTDTLGVATPTDNRFKLSNIVKRVADIVISILVLLLLFPVLFLVSTLIFILEGYPIFYISRRYISLDQCVSILKFRTMVTDATSPKFRLRERYMRDGYLDIPLHCEVYTPIGRLLERTQLVEILQLFNIIFHGMSLIGNRPLPKENIELLKKFKGWGERFDSPAGLTGLSQIVGKLNQSPQERLELECLYSSLYKSENGNILLCDLYIAYYTIRFLVFGKPLSIEGAKRLVSIASGK